MKFLDTHFNEYIESVKTNNLHTPLIKTYDYFPNKIEDMENVLFYGPQGTGKYSQMLLSISKYSPSVLKYDKKMCVVFNKTNYYYRISDIHVEIDMALLGCNSKLLWNDIYIQLLDVASAKPNNTLIVVCKNFQNIHSELLENFYSYMQTIKYVNIRLKFILITTSVCFIPSTILNRCKIINVPRPTKTMYAKCIKGSSLQNINMSNVINIKNLQIGQSSSTIKGYVNICNNIIEKLTKTDDFNFLQLRDVLYDLLIYDMDIYECIWYIIEELTKRDCIGNDQMVPLLHKVYIFFNFYNNNYRPIYHLESIMFYLIDIIKKHDEIKKSM